MELSMKYLLDTDHLTILERQTKGTYENLIKRMSQYDPSDFAISIVSVYEQMSGCNKLINTAKGTTDKKTENIIKGFDVMKRILEKIEILPIVPFDRETGQIYNCLQPQKLRLGKMDALIAATAIQHNLTLLTSNSKDFSKVANLTIEDWTINEEIEDAFEQRVEEIEL